MTNGMVKNDEMIHRLATSIRKRFENLRPISPKCCIYKIPRPLRMVNKSAYKPCLISIGPFHYGKKRLEPMQEHKLRYLRNFLKRNKKTNLSDYLKKIKLWEKEIRESYVENVELDSKEFNEMVLLDGCFLIEFLLLWFLDEAEVTDSIFRKPSMEVVIMRDILLLENQLPFFVLEGLYNIAFGNEKLVSPYSENSKSVTVVDDIDNSDTIRSLPSFMELCCQVLMVGKSEILEKFDDCKVLHLVDFLRTCYLPSVLRDPNEDENDDLDFPPTAERLKDAGIKFEVAKNGSLLDIEFSNGVLRIPKLEVEDHTESLLLNLSALELCHYHFDSYIIDYIVLMDVLITTLKDVDILATKGIIMNSLGTTEDFAEIFNTICKGTTYQVKGFYYSRLCKQLSAYYNTPWHRWRATLKHDYFSNPWAIISVIAAIVLVILTVVQTICTIISM